MKIIIIIIIGAGLLAGAASLILDGVPSLHISTGFLIVIIAILFLVIVLMMAILKAITTTSRSNDWGHGGGGGVDLPPLPINPHGYRQPKLPKYSKNKHLTDDDVIDGEVIDDKLLETSSNYEYKRLSSKVKIRK